MIVDRFDSEVVVEGDRAQQAAPDGQPATDRERIKAIVREVLEEETRRRSRLAGER